MDPFTDLNSIKSPGVYQTKAAKPKLFPITGGLHLAVMKKRAEWPCLDVETAAPEGEGSA